MSHTPCPCEILQVTNHDTDTRTVRIKYCHLHVAAPSLLAVLKEVLVDYRQCGMQDRQVMTVVKDAIQHAEGKE